MNRRMIFNAVGSVLQVEAFLLLLPAVVSLIYKENEAFAFLLTAVISFLIGLFPKLFYKPKTRVIFAKEGFIIVALTWFMLSVIGAMPFVLTREIPSFTDAFFETVSGFTTTGASVVTDVEALSHGALFWRSFTHWIGGMGILVFVMAVMPNISERPMNILKAEMPGPIKGKLVPKLKDTAVILYLIYVALTVAEIVLLCFGGISFFESVVYSFGTAGTGGFGIKGDSLASYSPYIQWVITIFMYIFGINFNLYYLILLKKVKDALKSSELWCYLGIIAIAIAVITYNIREIYPVFGEAIRHSAFQVAAIISTTGYSTTDFNLWPQVSKTIILILMFIGGCAGSTAGGMKVSRIQMFFKTVGNEIKRMTHPRSVNALKCDGKTIDNSTSKNFSAYFIVYMISFAAFLLLLSFEPFDFETIFTSVATCFNNIGPGFSKVGPMGSFSIYSDFSKYLLSLAMLMGRLEIFPIIIALSPSVWAKNK